MSRILRARPTVLRGPRYHTGSTLPAVLKKERPLTDVHRHTRSRPCFQAHTLTYVHTHGVRRFLPGNLENRKTKFSGACRRSHEPP